MLAKSPPFLMWYDDNPKLSVARKIEDAIAAYSDRFSGVKPTLVLVSEEEITEFAGIKVRGVATVRRHTYWVGQEDRPGAPAVEVEVAPPPTKPAPVTTRRKSRATTPA
ncbi:MAG: hypothetical protein HGA45_05275 [Chloroflexales bacterium]|nr:hypothetical protein [Chloroflexales bacterium]